MPGSPAIASPLAVVILNYNGAGFLRKFLPSVLRYSKGHRVIVADNASTDASVRVLEEEFPQVERLLLSENKGYAGGYNEALREIEARYYLLLNSDVEVSQGWLDPMLELLERSPEIAACQPKLLSYQQPSYFEYAGAAGGYIDRLAYPFCRGRIFDSLEKDRGQYDELAQIFWATGACMLLRSKVFHELGGFDPRFFAHMEEIDLCWRMQLAGYQIYACPQSVVYHVGGGTLPKSNPRKTFLNFRNNLWMLYKNSPAESRKWVLASRLLLDWAAALQFLLKGQLNNAWAVFKAHKEALIKLPDSATKGLIKGEKQKNRTKEMPIYKGFVVWDFYITGIRQFSRLKFQERNIRKVQKTKKAYLS